jgi:hypothetical protein
MALALNHALLLSLRASGTLFSVTSLWPTSEALPVALCEELDSYLPRQARMSLSDVFYHPVLTYTNLTHLWRTRDFVCCIA